MDAQLLGYVLSTERFYSDFLPQVKDSLRLNSEEHLIVDRTQKFRQENNRLPSWEELRLWYPEIASKNGISEEVVKEELARLITEAKVKACIIRIADDVDRRGIDKTKLFSAFDKLKEELNFKETLQEELPLPLTEFLKQDLPPLEYFIKDILQKSGRTMLSSSMNVGKSFFLQQLALAVSSGQPTFLNKFSITQGRVLYLDCEMGTSALKERFLKMAKNLDSSNLFIKYLPSLDLLNSESRQNLERWLTDLKIDVVIIDPIGNAWHGDENKAQDVSLVTSYLDSLREKYKVAILLSHHWKKRSKDLRRGFEMASGSYRWSAWLDCHLTLEGNIDNVIVSCEKARNSARFNPFMIKLSPDTLTFEFLADFERKYTEQTLIDLFNQADINNIGKVAISDLVRQANGKPSKATLHRLINESALFTKENTGQGKRAYLIKKSSETSDLFSSLSQTGDETVAEIKND